MNQSDFIKQVQVLLNRMGANPQLMVDGAAGPRTISALNSAVLKHEPAVITIPGLAKPQEPFWVSFLLSRLGWTEFDHDAELSKDWPMVGLPQFKTVIGIEHAWCAMEIEAALRSGGLQGTGSAGASSYRNYGEPCEYLTGAILSLRHAGGGNHVTCFLYWKDKEKKLAACLGGNQGNSMNITTFNLSGNDSGHDEVVGGPRWPLGYPKTGYVYAAHGGEAAAGSTT